MGLANLILRFLRLGPLGLGLIAVAILGAGYFLQVEMNKDAAIRAQVLIDGPPAMVDIAAFDPDVHANAAGEVVVQAQPVFTYAYRLTLEKNAHDDHVFMVPLVAPSSSVDTDVIGIAYYTSPSEDFENINNELLMRDSVAFGSVGPISNYNGDLGSMGQWAEMTREAFVDEGLQMPASPVVVWPYQEGRAVALAPDDFGGLTVFGLLSKVAGVIGLLALAKLVIRQQNSAPEEALVAEAAVEMEAKAPDVPRQAMYRAPAPEPQHEPEVAVSMPEAEETMRVSGRRGFGLRKIMIGIVGAAFAVLLVSVLSGLLQDSAASDQVASIGTPEEVVAGVVADYVVPDADPNRHWTDIDVTPVIEWVVAKGLLALSGDTDAMFVIAMIAGGVLFAPIMLWFFFRTRSSFAPKTSARFDAMGIN